MKINSSYGVEIRKAGGGLSITLKIYREAVRVLSLFYDTVWEELSAVEGKMRRFNFAEHLVHSTKKNRAVHDFDMRFPKMPSYLRRSAITHALGVVASYRTRPRSSGRERMRCPYFTGGTCTGKAKGTRPVSNFITGRTGCG